jgi:hypothetical protein
MAGVFSIKERRLCRGRAGRSASEKSDFTQPTRLSCGFDVDQGLPSIALANPFHCINLLGDCVVWD